MSILSRWFGKRKDDAVAVGKTYDVVRTNVGGESDALRITRKFSPQVGRSKATKAGGAVAGAGFVVLLPKIVRAFNADLLPWGESQDTEAGGIIVAFWALVVSIWRYHRNKRKVEQSEEYIMLPED